MDVSYRRLVAWVALCACLGGCGHTATLAFYPEQQEEAQGLITPAEPEMIVGISSDADLSLFLPEGLARTSIQTVTGEITYTPVTQETAGFFRSQPELQFFSIPLSMLAGPESLTDQAPRHPWDIAHDQLLSMQQSIEKHLQESAAFTEAEARPFIVIEPDITLIDSKQTERQLKERARDERMLRRAKGTEAVADTVLVPPSKVWPAGEAFWHKSDAYTQLTSAAKRIEQQFNGEPTPVVIAQLDTGYNTQDAYRPLNLDAANSLSFTGGNTCNSQGEDGGGINRDSKTPGHGQRMLSVLAGPQATIDGKTDTLGGDPFASVRVYRIAERFPIHLSTRRMTAAIDCARVNGVDVISMSAGGLPSIAQRNAVNAAYDGGVAIFAATGDFFHIPFTPIKLIGESAVFPARYNRVIGVAGATSEHESYGDSPGYLKMLDWPVKPLLSRVGSWMLRGSFGPESAMAEHTVVGYSPNIDHAFSMSEEQRYVRRNGAGTSSSTPQAAAAASLWLAQERAAIGEEKWRTWEKTEAVYAAMLKAAADATSKDTRYDDIARFGEGPVKANDMLNIRYIDLKADLNQREESRIGYVWLLQTLESSGLLSVIPGTRAAQLDMLLTEAMQVVETSSRAQRTLKKIRACQARRDDCEKLIASELRKIVKKEAERMSETLKANILAGLKEWVKEA